MGKIEILPFGDSAILVNFKQKIDHKISMQVMQLADDLEGESCINFVTPSYCSLLVGFDLATTDYGLVKDKILRRIAIKHSADQKSIGRRFNIPVCYHESLGLDLAVVCELTNLKREKVIEIHTKKYFRVFVVGFLPGFSYLGVLPKSLHCQRRKTPRLKVPAGSVGIAGAQTGIYPAEVPGGWQILGQTPIQIFRPLSEMPFLLRAGDEVKFLPISLSSYQEISEQVVADKFNWRNLLA